jgi:hypothetical protein
MRNTSRRKRDHIVELGFYLTSRPVPADVAKRAGVAEIGPVTTAPTAWKEDDRRWFKNNPKRSHRLRPMFPQEPRGEPPVAPHPHHEFQVLVRQIEPGLRLRQPFYRDLTTPIPDSEHILHAMFDLYTDPARVPGQAVSMCTVTTLALRYAGAQS